jgi:hypothetical protein
MWFLAKSDNVLAKSANVYGKDLADYASQA